MDPYIELWLEVIDGMSNDNTYKLAWGRAIVEICHFSDPISESGLEIHFKYISQHFSMWSLILGLSSNNNHQSCHLSNTY